MAADVAPPVQAGARPLLSVQGLAAWFGPLRALDRVDLSLRPGELVALAGENGAGKTTLVRCISVTWHPVPGRYCWRAGRCQRTRLRRCGAGSRWSGRTWPS